MPSLSTSDYRGALEVLGEAAAVDGPIPFPEPVLDALRGLVPCDVVAYHEEGSPAMPARASPASRERDDSGNTRRRQALLAPGPDHPGGRRAEVLSFLSRREYHRLELYQEADRPLGIEYMMRLWLDPGAGGARLEFDRAGPDFGERDRAVLDLLLPHLKQFRRSAATRRRESARSVNGRDGLTLREREILHCVAEGRTNAEVAWLLRISPQTVRKHLENAYEKLGVHTRTGAVAALFELERARHD